MSCTAEALQPERSAVRVLRGICCLAPFDWVLGVASFRRERVSGRAALRVAEVCELRVGGPLVRASQPCRTTATFEAQVPVIGRSEVHPFVPTQAAQERLRHRVSSREPLGSEAASSVVD